jgi:hypothetical protein
LSLTTHSGAGASLLAVLGHIPFSLATGAVIPILVKAETLSGEAPATTVFPYTSQVVCNMPPITNLATGACVCSSGSTIPTGEAKKRREILSWNSAPQKISMNATMAEYTSSFVIIKSQNMSS